MFTHLIQTLKDKFMPDTAPLTYEEKYRLHRIKMEDYFIKANAVPEPKEERSPSGRYRLCITKYTTGPGTWAYSRGQVYDGEKLIADVKRNYHSFERCWVEGHPNGHDYLVAGEDCQGQTIIELDTGKRADSGTTEATAQGHGFCWVHAHASPDKKVLAVDGCYWGAPFEVVLFDFSEPMKLPHPELERWDEAEGFDSWETQGQLKLSRTVAVRKSDGKPLDDLSMEEVDAAEAADDLGETKITKTWEPKSLSEARS